MKHPLALVKEKFESKDKLIAAVKAFANDDKLWFKRSVEGSGLEHVSNAKLLKLHETFSAVKEKFGSRGALITAILEADGRPKDTGWKIRLEGYPVPRLFDLYKSATKRQKAASKAEKA